MPLSWSFDKIGPLTRTPRDAALVFAALAGADPGDPDSVANSFPSHADIGILNAEHPHVRIGHMPRWFHGDGDSAEAASPRKRDLLQYCEKRPEFSLHEITLPDLPYRDLSYLLLADAAAVFEDLTLSDQDDLLSKQDPDGWPNIFRGAHFLSAVEYLQLQRFRRHCLCVFEETLEAVDVIMAPAYADQGNLLVLTTATGHPSITLPIGFTADGLPDSITLFGKPYSEATLVRAAELIMEEFNLDNRRPALP
jgi:Asp-tRNA(Asn)/Glu-tRNA(Gln) amidotransferase A subunit family amidase